MTLAGALGRLRRILRGERRPLRSEMKSPRYFHFIPSRFSFAELRDRVREIIDHERALDGLLPAFEVGVRLEAPVTAGATLSEAHRNWIDAGNIETPEGLPRQPPDARCPPGLVRVSVECVTRQSGGMSSYYGFEGYFVSLLVDIGQGTIWDARGEKAS